MRPTLATTLFLTTSMSIVAACGGGDAEGGGSSGGGDTTTGGSGGGGGSGTEADDGPPSVATICAEVIGLQCRGHVACCDREAEKYASEDECRSILEPLCTTDLAGVAYGDGRISFHLAEYQAALERAREAIQTCAPLAVGIWDAIYVGRGDEGADCTPTEDGMDYSPMLACSSGFGCIGGEESEARACTPLAGDGEACADVECAAGLYCHGSGRSASCRAREDDGARCSGPADCQSGFCTDDGRCGARTAAVSYCGDLSYP